MLTILLCVSCFVWGVAIGMIVMERKWRAVVRRKNEIILNALKVIKLLGVI